MLLKPIFQLTVRISHKAIKMNVPLPLRICNVVGHQLIGQRRLQEAETVFQDLSRRFPKKPQGYEGAAKVAMLTGEWAIAIKNWKQVLEVSLENEDALYRLGLAQSELKDYDQAKATFQKYTQVYSDRYQGYEGMAFLLQKTFQYEEADKWLEISITQTQARSSFLKRARLLVRFAQFEEGLAVMDALLAKHGKEVKSLTVKTDLLLKAGRNNEAIELLADLYSHTPSVTVRRLYAQAMIAAKQYDKACDLIEQIPLPAHDSKALHPHHPVMITKNLKTWQKYHMDGRSTEKPKVFGIGLSRTGTTSLTKALDILGYDTIHFINPITQKVLDLEDFFYFDGFTDSPVAYRFEELYALFPNAKFIYTERNIEDWIRSNSALYEPFGFSTTQEMKAWFTQPESGKFNKLFQNYHPTYRAAYESLYADFPTWEDAYHAFEERVNLFFEDKPKEKLLKINIPEGEGWEKLCSFMNVPVPDLPFPHRNKLKSSDS